MAGKDVAVRATQDKKHAKQRSARSRIWVMAVEHNYCCTKCGACNKDFMRLYLQQQ